MTPKWTEPRSAPQQQRPRKPEKGFRCLNCGERIPENGERGIYATRFCGEKCRREYIGE